MINRHRCRKPIDAHIFSVVTVSIFLIRSNYIIMSRSAFLMNYLSFSSVEYTLAWLFMSTFSALDGSLFFQVDSQQFSSITVHHLHIHEGGDYFKRTFSQSNTSICSFFFNDKLKYGLFAHSFILSPYISIQSEFFIVWMQLNCKYWKSWLISFAFAHNDDKDLSVRHFLLICFFSRKTKEPSCMQFISTTKKRFFEWIPFE